MGKHPENIASKCCVARALLRLRAHYRCIGRDCKLIALMVQAASGQLAHHGAPSFRHPVQPWNALRVCSLHDGRTPSRNDLSAHRAATPQPSSSPHPAARSKTMIQFPSMAQGLSRQVARPQIRCLGCLPHNTRWVSDIGLRIHPVRYQPRRASRDSPFVAAVQERFPAGPHTEDDRPPNR
jgi:hypothetical protein